MKIRPVFDEVGADIAEYVERCPLESPLAFVPRITA